MLFDQYFSLIHAGRLPCIRMIGVQTEYHRTKYHRKRCHSAKCYRKMSHYGYDKNGVTKSKVVIKVKVMVNVRFMSHFFPGHFSCKQSIPVVLPLVGLMDPPVAYTSYTLNKSQLDIQDELNLIVSLDIQNCANLLCSANTNLLAIQS